MNGFPRRGLCLCIACAASSFPSRSRLDDDGARHWRDLLDLEQHFVDRVDCPISPVASVRRFRSITLRTARYRSSAEMASRTHRRIPSCGVVRAAPDLRHRRDDQRGPVPQLIAHDLERPRVAECAGEHDEVGLESLDLRAQSSSGETTAVCVPAASSSALSRTAGSTS